MLQQTLFSKQSLRYLKRYTHGGSSYKRRRKTKRPLIPGAVTHIVFKSSKARGRWCFLRNQRVVRALLEERTRKFFVEVVEWVNMGNHLHLKVRFKDAESFQNFLRTFPAMLARKITGARRGRKLRCKFWDGIAFTRVLTSKLEELGLKGYFQANREQRLQGSAARDEYLQKFNQFLYRLRRTRAAPVAGPSP